MTNNPWNHNRIQNIHKMSTKESIRQVRELANNGLPRKTKKKQKTQAKTFIYVGEFLDSIAFTPSKDW